MLGRLGIVVAVLAFGLASATAGATPQDVRSTQAYVRANYELARASDARTAAAQANIVALDRKLARECRHVGTGAPQEEQAQLMGYEVAVALWSVSFGTDRGPIRSFVASVKRLRWSNPRLTALAHRYASDLQALATLPMPNLCGDARAWKASGFKVLPAATTSVDRRVEAIEPNPIPRALLARYEQPADRSIVARTTRLETKLQRIETVTGFDDWEMLLDTLALNE